MTQDVTVFTLVSFTFNETVSMVGLSLVVGQIWWGGGQ